MTRLQALIVTLISALALARTAAAQYDLSWHTIDCGGQTFATGGTFELGATSGQPDAGIVMTGGAFALTGGFWAGSGPAIDTCPADIAPLPGGDGVVNTADLLAVINSWGLCPVPPAGCPADIAPPGPGNGIVNTGDLLAVINAWGACP